MKRLMLIALLMFALPVCAADSGVYYNVERDGEGLSLHRSGDAIVAFFFTYGGVDPEVIVPQPPYLSPQTPLESPLNGQRWFMIAGDLLIENTVASGLLYQTGGINYPVPLEPNGIGSAVPVGEYELMRVPGGWELTVIPLEFDNYLDANDPLFIWPFIFQTLLFSSDD